MRLFVFGGLSCFLHLSLLTEAATIPSPALLNSAVPSSPFNLTIPQDANSSLSALPRVPYAYEVPGTNMVLLFTSFGNPLRSTDVFSALIDATCFAIDGMIDDGLKPTPQGPALSWHQGAIEFSITPSAHLNYNMLATSIAGLQAVGLSYGSIRGGIYAAEFNIYILNVKVGSGKLWSRPPDTIAASPSPSNSTATARALTFPPDPFAMRVEETDITVIFSSYRGPLVLPEALDLFLDVILIAAGAIRDSRQDVLIGRSWVFRRNAQMNLYPKQEMTWGDLATAVKGMKHFVLTEGSVDFRFEVEFDRMGSLSVGLGAVGALRTD